MSDECDVKQQFPLANHPVPYGTPLLKKEGNLEIYKHKKNSPPDKGEYPKGGRGLVIPVIRSETAQYFVNIFFKGFGISFMIHMCIGFLSNLFTTELILIGRLALLTYPIFYL